MATKALTKREAIAVGYFYAMEFDKVWRFAKYLGVGNYESTSFQRLMAGLVRKGYLVTVDKQVYEIVWGKGAKIAENDPRALRARLDIAKANNYDDEIAKIKTRLAELDREKKPSAKKQKPKAKASTTTASAKPTGPTKPKPLTPKQRSWLSWLFRGDPRVKR